MSVTESSGRDSYRALEDIIDELSERECRIIVMLVEDLLSARGHRHRPTSGDMPSHGTLKKKEDPPKPPAKYRHFKIPPRWKLKGLGKSGDGLACVLRCNRGHLPRSSRVAKRKGMLGKWFVFVPGEGDIDIMRIDGFGSKMMRGPSYLPNEDRFCKTCQISRSGFNLFYEVMECQPSSDRNWRADRKFVAAIEAMEK